MVLKLDQKQANSLTALVAGHGKRSGTGIFIGTRTNLKITDDQLLKLKKLQKQGLGNKAIRTKLGLSEYIVKMAMNKQYDHILPKKENTRRT